MERTEGFDRSAALLLLAVLSPVVLLRGLLALCWGRVFDRQTMPGRAARPLQRLSFAGPLPGRGLAQLINVLRGELALVGPRPQAGGSELPAEYQGLLAVRPGLVSPADVRRLLGMDHAGALAIERDWLGTRSVRGNLGILARWSISRALYGSDRQPAPPALDFFGLSVVNATMGEALDWMQSRWSEGDCTVMHFVNPHCLNVAWTDARYFEAMRQADCILPDGSGIKLGCRMQGLRLRGNPNGTDLFPLLCERLAATGDALFLLGGSPGVAQATADNMCARYPGLKIAGVRHGYFAAEDEAALIGEINASGAAVLLVAMGVPTQELWVQAHRAALRVGLAMGVGGLFDFYSGRIPRAPMWLRELGLEWTWRLLQEPRRMWRRYVIGNPLFLWRVWRAGHGRRPAHRVG